MHQGSHAAAASEMGISVHTVQAHLTALRTRLGVHNETQAIYVMWLGFRDHLAELTARSDLGGLTLLPWTSVLSAVHLLRGTMAFCPLCLDEMATANLVYEPLAWAIRLVTVCIVHKRSLELECSQCGRSQRAFRWHGRPGICGHCRTWLGDAAASKVEASGDALATSRAVASMLLVPPHPDVDPVAVGAALQRGIAQLGISATAFAKAAGVGGGSVSSWSKGTLKLSLPGVVGICSIGGWPVGDFLDGRINGAGEVRRVRPSPWRGRRWHDWELVRLAVVGHAGDEPPITLVALGAELGITYPWLRRRLPEETQVLVNRRAAWERQRAQARSEALVVAVAETTRRLLDAGRTASAREVESFLPPSVSLREPSLAEAWHQAKAGWSYERESLPPAAA